MSPKAAVDFWWEQSNFPSCLAAHSADFFWTTSRSAQRFSAEPSYWFSQLQP
jgi:hypothetical protein